jgi:hypothetical protein
VRQAYDQGEYALASATGVNPPTPGITYPLRDFVVELDARLAPPTPGAIIAIDLRRQANGDHYCWQIDLNGGAFALMHIRGQGSVNLIPLTRSSALRQGGAWNHFAARVRGSEIVLVVNGQEVGRATDATIPEGGVSMGVGSATGGASGARFDNFVVRNPD